MQSRQNLLTNIRNPQYSLLHSYTLWVVMLVFSPPFAHPLSFNITSFDDTSNIISYQGDSTPANGSIELNVPSLFRVGRAVYTQPLHLWDSSTGVLSDLTTRFSFIVDAKNTSLYSDGFAFFIAPFGYPIPPNSGSGFLGLFNSTNAYNNPENHVIFVEFDTFLNDFDPAIQHVGININAIESRAYAFFDIGNNIGKQCNALIAYNSSTKGLSVFWSFNASSTGSLSYKINLMEDLPQWVTIGFSVSTGLYSERNVIHSWEFSSTLNSTYSKVDSNRGSKRQNKVVPVVVATCSFVFVLLVVSICWFIVRRKRKEFKNHGLTLVESNLDRAATHRRFHYQELVRATNGFADDQRLGQGGSGQVYKGVLSDIGRVVAIKRISTKNEYSERIFTNEVKIISRLIHKNLVQFIGWCHEQGELLLIFEYMPNGSLDTHLFGNKRTLPWNVRYRIAIGVATALHYLHEDAEQSVLHRDIKSANVLLDADFNTKLGDFGVAKLVDPRSRTQTTGLVGTYGYLAPEYINGGRASKESDVYGFGVVALEIACGRRNFQDGEYHMSLVNWVWQHYVKGTLLNVADKGLKSEFDESEMRCLLIMGLWCTHPKDKKRPKAAQVIKALQLEATLPMLPHDMHDFPPLSFLEHSNSFQSAPITTSIDNVGR